MSSITLIKTIALIGLYVVPLFILLLPFFSRKPMKPWMYVFHSVVLLLCASVILITIHQLKTMSDDLTEKEREMKIGQIMSAQNHIKMNQALMIDLITKGGSELEFSAKLDSPKDLLNSEEKSNKSYFDSFLFMFEAISALFAIPLAVNFFVHGVTSRHYTSNVYEVPKAIYGKISRLESSLSILIGMNIILTVVVLFAVFS